MTTLLPDNNETTTWDYEPGCLPSDWYPTQALPRRLHALSSKSYPEHDTDDCQLRKGKAYTGSLPNPTQKHDSLYDHDCPAYISCEQEPSVTTTERAVCGALQHPRRALVTKKRRIHTWGKYQRILYKNIQIIFGPKAAKKLQGKQQRFLRPCILSGYKAPSLLDNRLCSLENRLKALESHNKNLRLHATLLEGERDYIAEKEQSDRRYLLELESRLADIQRLLVA